MFRLRGSSCSGLAVAVCLTLLCLLPVTPARAAKSKVTGVLSEVAGLLKKQKPVCVLSNVRIVGRLASLFTEMDVKGYNELDISTDFDARAVKDSTILVLLDRESGNYRPDQEYLVPVTARPVANGENAVLAVGEHKDARGHARPTVFISAPSRDALVDFLNTDLREDRTRLKDYRDPSNPKIVRKSPQPPTPVLLFPRGDVKSMRPPVFFVVHKSNVRLLFDIQLCPSGKEREYRRDEFGKDGNAFVTPEGGWVAFGIEARPATDHQLDAWQIKQSDELKRWNYEILVYEPEFDVSAGSQYTARVRSAFAGAGQQPGLWGSATAQQAGLWSSVEEAALFSLPAQPENLGPAMRLTATENADELSPAFSTDGSLLLYSTNRANGIWEIYADDARAPGTGSTRVTQSNRMSEDVHPAWGPIDENGVSYCTFERYETNAANPIRNIWSVAVATAAAPKVPFGYTRYTNFPEDSLAPCWSQDGKRLAFVKLNEQGNDEIWIMEAGKNPRVLCNGVDPAWDSDGKTLFYSSDANGSWDIWRMDTTTGQQAVVTMDGENDEFSPAPNPGDTGDLAYVSNTNGNLDIWVLRGGTPIQLTQWLGNDISPTWMPDGKRIIFATTRFSAKLRYDLASIDPYGMGAAPGNAGQ